MKKYFLTLIVLSACIFQVSAQTTWHLAPGRSSVHFEIDHLLFFKVEGRFKKFEGTVVTQGEDFATAEIEGKIQANSVYTGNQDRDKDLAGEDFFYTSKFPEILFKSKSVVKTGDNTYDFNGDLSIRGVTKPIVLKAKYKSKEKLSNGKTRVNLSVTGSLNRYDYGLKWNEIIESGKAIVGDEVDIKMNIALLKDNE